ncbi:MAG TPA: zinc-regulated TonB-dependent outer membrane receptor, partial [Polyangia bacterium]
MTVPGRLTRARVVLVVACLLPATRVRAQSPALPPSTTPPPSATTPPVPSTDDLAAIEQSLAADAASKADHATAQGGQGPAPAAQPGPALNPDLSVILNAALAGFSEDEPRQDGGHDPAKSGFTLQQLELSLGKAVDPYFRFDASIVFSPFGVEVEEAFATAVALPGSLQLRAGQFLTRFGRHNPTHLHAWEFLDQPFVWSRVFGGEGNRGAG